VESNAQLAALSSCTTFTGSITLSDRSLTSLAGLDALTSITGNISFIETGLDKDDLHSLAALDSVGGQIRMENNLADFPVCEVQEWADELSPAGTVVDLGGNNSDPAECE
jgi:hypothetical protein